MNLLNLKLMGYEARIKDLEQEILKLRKELNEKNKSTSVDIATK